jgi:hypothetical protein
MSNKYTQLLAALGASDMSHAAAVALAMSLVLGDPATNTADENRVARKIGGLVLEDSAAPDDILNFDARFDDLGDNALAFEPADGSLNVGDLTNPALQLGEVASAPAGVSPSGFTGVTFTEGAPAVPGGRNLVTYAYTDVEDPQPEDFETAYGRLDGVGGGGEYHAAPTPVVTLDDDGGNQAAYQAYLNLVKAYEDNLTEIRQGDFAGHPEAGGPSNTPEGQKIAMTDQPTSVEHFWDHADIQKTHLPNDPEPIPAPEMNPPIIGPAPSPEFADYRPVGHEDGASELLGTFDGVAGKFICTEAGSGGVCKITASRSTEEATRNDIIYTRQVGDAWKFVANSRTASVRTPRKDGDYLVMGWWLEKPDQSTGDFGFGRFYAGSDPVEDSNLPSTGTATYDGTAVGKYAERDVGSETARKGLFTANAELEATWGGAGTSVEGTVKGFVDELGESRAGWHVILGDGNVTSGEADGRDWSGAWDSSFYGNDATEPTSIAGMFNATFGCPEMMAPCVPPENDAGVGFVGVSGVFGAYWQTPPPPEEMNGN